SNNLIDARPPRVGGYQREALRTGAALRLAQGDALAIGPHQIILPATVGGGPANRLAGYFVKGSRGALGKGRQRCVNKWRVGRVQREVVPTRVQTRRPEKHLSVADLTAQKCRLAVGVAQECPAAGGVLSHRESSKHFYSVDLAQR